MVAYLTKSDASEGFTQIIDFLNGSYIKYALTVNLNIYVSCIKQFWTNVAIKQVNDVTRLQALVDKKKVVVIEAAIREVLRLDDAKDVDCLSNEEIFIELARMRVGKGFSRVETPLFKGMLVGPEIEEEGDADEHVEDVTAGDDAHGDDTASYGEVPTVQRTPPQSPPVQPQPQPQPQPQQAADFSMSLLQEALDACAALTRRVEHFKYDKVAQALEITKLKRRVKKLEKRNKVKVLKLRRLQRVGTSQRVDTSDDTVMDDASNQERMIAEMDKDDAVVLMDDKEKDKKVEEAKVVESAQVQGRQAESHAEIYKIDMDHANKVLSIAIIPTAEPQVPAATLTAAPAKVVATPSRRRKGVVIRDPEEESTTSTIIPSETKSKDKGKEILVEEPKPLKKKQQIEMDEEYARNCKKISSYEKEPQTEAQARKNMMMYLKNVDGFKLDYFKGMSYDEIRPIFEAKFNSNVDFLLKTKEQIEEEESRALQTIIETPVEKAAKRRKLNEEVEDLKRHLEIVLDKDDDVYNEATPLARKVPVVDYEIIEINNKPYYKIIRADGTHQLYISFLTLLNNFDKEDLKALWNLVKERFSTAKPKNFSCRCSRS
nr:hypothetical protein [Tanacetum cinerariifolium]